MAQRVGYIGNVKSAPIWAKDFGGREHVMPFPAKIDPSQFTDKAGIVVTLGAGATAGDTSLTVTALALPLSPATALITTGNVLIPAGTTLSFGTNKFARLTADALIGATTLTVAAIPTNMSSGDVAIFSRYGTEFIPSGTVLGRTYAERDAGTAFGPAAVTDDEIYLLMFDVVDARVDNDCELYRHGSLVAENYLPDYTSLNTGANEVQTIAVDTIMSGGKIDITAVKSDGTVQDVNVAYNTSWTQTVADIQTALIAVLGTSAVAAAVTNTHDMTLTFSGTGYAGKAQPLVGVDISGATGPTKVSVTRSTAGGTGILTILRNKYRCITGQD